MIEIWKNIEGYNEDYQVSDLGRIKSFKRYKSGEILKQNKNGTGYLVISLCENGKYKSKRIHTLLFETFNGCKLKLNEVIHHINENPLNNNLDNLQKMTKFEHNSLHKSGENHPFFGKKRPDVSKRISGENNPMFKIGENNPQAILTERNIVEIWKYLNKGDLIQKEIGLLFGVNQRTISNIKNGKSWGDVLKKYKNEIWRNK